MPRLILILLFLLTACSATTNTTASPTIVNSGGQDPGLEQRHRAPVPEAYAGLKSPESNGDMLKKGEAIYAASCVSCHGADGLGDGQAGAALTPAPAPVALTSQTLSDGYLYWRIAEGGLDFGSAMPAWKGVLAEGDIWSVIVYIRSLGLTK